MEEIKDLAEGTFVEKIPSWVRWILFIPAAFLGSVLGVFVIGILSWLSMSFTGATEEGWWFGLIQLFQSGLLGYLFVAFGATVIPKGQFAASIVFLIFAVIISVFIFQGNFNTQTTHPLLMLLHSVLVIAGSGVAVYMVHEGDSLFD